jgi:rhodanese-related sulfurtransferase
MLLTGFKEFAMSRKKILRAGLILLCISAAGYAYTAGHTPEPAKITAVGIHEIMESGNQDYLIYDMRENFDYVIRHIPGAINIPVRMLEKRATEIPREKPIVLIFRNDDEAGKVWKFLMDNGYNPEYIKIYGEDMDAWTKAGYPVEDFIIHGC